MTHNVSVMVAFECVHETHPLEEFQRGGHFVPGMVDVEQRRREWEGDTVHVLALHWHGVQVLRVLADSQAEAERLMRANIEGSLFAALVANQAAAGSYDQMKRMVDRAGKLQEFIDSHPKIGKRWPSHFEDVFAAAMYYLTVLAEGGGQ